MNAHTAWQECAQKRLVRVRSDSSCFEEEEECVCVCVCSAHVCRVMSSCLCEKKPLYKYARPVKISCPGWGSGPRHSHFYYIPPALWFEQNRFSHYYPLLTFNTSLYAHVWYKKWVHILYVREKEICYVAQQWFSLKIRQTHCYCLATTHPTVQTSSLSFIQRHVSLKETHTHTHSAAWYRHEGCIIYLLKQSMQPDPERRLRTLGDFSGWQWDEGLHIKICTQQRPERNRTETKSSEAFSTLKAAITCADTICQNQRVWCKDACLPKTSGHGEWSGRPGIT